MKASIFISMISILGVNLYYEDGFYGLLREADDSSSTLSFFNLKVSESEFCSILKTGRTITSLEKITLRDNNVKESLLLAHTEQVNNGECGIHIKKNIN